MTGRVFKLDVRDNFPDVMRYLQAVGKQGRYAAAVALTKTGEHVRSAERVEMVSVFDRPTPYTLNSLYLRPAKPTDLTVEVWLKDDRAGSGTPATKYLLPEIEGGKRSLKGFERALQRFGILPTGMFAVPGTAIKLDNYGNVSKGLLNQILSQLRVQVTAGYESRATGSARSNRTIRKQGVEYFALSKRRGKLPPGIYARYKFAHGSAVRPMFVFTRAPSYRRLFKFFEVAERVGREVFPRYFAEEFEAAMRTAR